MLHFFYTYLDVSGNQKTFLKLRQSSKKQEIDNFLFFDVFGAKPVKTDVRIPKLGFQVVRDALQPQSKYDAENQLCSWNFPKKQDFDKILFLALK